MLRADGTGRSGKRAEVVRAGSNDVACVTLLGVTPGVAFLATGAPAVKKSASIPAALSCHDKENRAKYIYDNMEAVVWVP